MEDIKIRSGQPGDMDAVVHLMRRLAEHEGLAQHFELTSESLRQCCFGVPRRMELIVAEAEAVIVGYATCMVQFSPWAAREYLFLDDLYVSEAARGRGVGSRLMRQVGAIALERLIDVRWHVENENRSAQRFYQSIGADLREKLIAYWPLDVIRSRQR